MEDKTTEEPTTCPPRFGAAKTTVTEKTIEPCKRTNFFTSQIPPPKKKEARDLSQGLTNDDYDILREQLRIVKGMKRTVTEESKMKKLDIVKSPLLEVKNNKLVKRRKNYIKCKMQDKIEPLRQDLERLKYLAERSKHEPQGKVRMNHAAKVRWMKIRNMPVYSEDFQTNFDMFGRPAFRVPSKYVPFNVLWEAAWIKQPYIWEDE